jgi:hypothetical protein
MTQLTAQHWRSNSQTAKTAFEIRPGKASEESQGQLLLSNGHSETIEKLLQHEETSANHIRIELQEKRSN